MPALIIEYAFEELPLIVESGFEAGLVNGSAEIWISGEGEWFVKNVFLDGYRKSQRKPVEVSRTSWLFLAIHDRLENGSFKSSIDDKVQAAIEGELTNRRAREFA